MNQMKMKAFVILFVLVFDFSATVQADPPHRPDLVMGGNRWVATFFVDNSPTHVVFGVAAICFVSVGPVVTHQEYTWFLEVAPGVWNGRATQEADQVFMHGDFTFGGVPELGHDGAEWELVSENMGTGHWKAWIEDGGFGSPHIFTNVALVRTGTCGEGMPPVDMDMESPFNKLLPPPTGLEQGFKEQGIQPLR